MLRSVLKWGENPSPCGEVSRATGPTQTPKCLAQLFILFAFVLFRSLFAQPFGGAYVPQSGYTWGYTSPSGPDDATTKNRRAASVTGMISGCARPRARALVTLVTLVTLASGWNFWVRFCFGF